MKFSFGAVWNRFFQLFGQNIGLFIGLGLLFTVLPSLVFNYGLFTMAGVNSLTWTRHIASLTPTAYGLGGGGGLIVWLLSLLNIAAVTEVAILRAVGKPARFGEVLGHAAANMLPLFVVSLIYIVLMMLGFVLLFVPGLMFAIAACVAVPAYVGEPGVGIWGAFKRSFALTKGHRWMILLLFIVIGVVMSIISQMITFPLMGGMTAIASGHIPMSALLISITVNGIVQIINYVFIAAIYVVLRESKDRFTPEQTASVF